MNHKTIQTTSKTEHIQTTSKTEPAVPHNYTSIAKRITNPFQNYSKQHTYVFSTLHFTLPSHISITLHYYYFLLLVPFVPTAATFIIAAVGTPLTPEEDEEATFASTLESSTPSKPNSFTIGNDSSPSGPV